MNSFAIARSGSSMSAKHASMISAKLWGGMLVAIPTAIPYDPFTRRFGNRAGMTVGFSQMESDNPWRIAETKSLRDEAAKRGVTLVVTDAQGQTAKQVADVEDLIARKVSLNPNSRVIGFGKGTVYVVRTDDDDLQYLERYKR